MNYFDSNNCGFSCHTFARNGEDEIDAYHTDNTICTSAEFNLTEILEDDLPRMYRCPWCDLFTTDTDHMRACSGYQKPATADEIRDSLSDPTEHAKRDILLSQIET